MLIAILIGLYLHFGGGQATALAPQFKQAEANIKKDVHDEARRKQALDIVGQMKSTMSDFTKGREKSAKAIDATLSKREATADELRAAAAPLLAEDKRARERMLDLQFELRSVLTATEWAEIYPKPAH